MLVVKRDLLSKAEMKKKRLETQTLRAGCSKVEPKIFALPQTPPPLPWGAGRPNFNQLDLPTYRPSLLNIDERNFELSWQQTHTHKRARAHTQTHRQDRLQFTAPLSLARSVKIQKSTIAYIDTGSSLFPAVKTVGIYYWRNM